MLCCMWEEDARQTIRELCQDRLIALDAGVYPTNQMALKYSHFDHAYGDNGVIFYNCMVQYPRRTQFGYEVHTSLFYRQR